MSRIGDSLFHRSWARAAQNAALELGWDGRVESCQSVASDSPWSDRQSLIVSFVVSVQAPEEKDHIVRASVGDRHGAVVCVHSPIDTRSCAGAASKGRGAAAKSDETAGFQGRLNLSTNLHTVTRPVNTTQ